MVLPRSSAASPPGERPGEGRGRLGELRRRVVLGHYALGVLVVLGFDAFLGEIGQWVSLAGGGLEGGVDDHGAAINFVESEASDRPKDLAVFLDPSEVSLPHFDKLFSMW